MMSGWGGGQPWKDCLPARRSMPTYRRPALAPLQLHNHAKKSQHKKRGQQDVG